MSTSASTGLRELLVRCCAGLTSEQVDALEAHYELLVRWNRVVNLTAIRSLEEVAERHYCESLFLASHVAPGRLRIADIGSGAGFPGFPVAVFRPDCSVTLIESHQRKAVFLREAARRVGNVRVLAQRAEAVGERFDLAISRAVGYEDLAPYLGKLAPRAMLLTGQDVPPESLGFGWLEPISLPWGKQRYLRMSL